MAWGAAAAAIAALLSGCVGGEDAEESAAPSVPSASASAEPTDEELIAEARGVYESFLAASNAMWDEPEVDYTAWLESSSPEIASEEAAGQQALRDGGVASMGPISLAAFEPAGEIVADRVDAFVCLDFSEARRFASDGSDITPEEAVDRAGLQVRFEREDARLLLTTQEGLTDGQESPCW